MHDQWSPPISVYSDLWLACKFGIHVNNISMVTAIYLSQSVQHQSQYSVADMLCRSLVETKIVLLNKQKFRSVLSIWRVTLIVAELSQLLTFQLNSVRHNPKWIHFHFQIPSKWLVPKRRRLPKGELKFRGVQLFRQLWQEVSRKWNQCSKLVVSCTYYSQFLDEEIIYDPAALGYHRLVYYTCIKDDNIHPPPPPAKLKGGILVSHRPCICGQTCVRSVTSTIPAGSISYLHILLSRLRRCGSCKGKVFCKIWIFGNFFKFVTLILFHLT